jgi:hypothetical protein
MKFAVLADGITSFAPVKDSLWRPFQALGMPRLFDFEQRALPCRKGALHDLLKTI